MKSVGFFLLWLVGSVIAVSVAFAGIAVVDDELIDPPPAQVSNVRSGSVGGPNTEVPSVTPDAPSTATVAAVVSATAGTSSPVVTPTRVAQPTPVAQSTPRSQATPVPTSPTQPTPVPTSPTQPTPVPTTSAPQATSVPSTPVPEPTAVPSSTAVPATPEPTAPEFVEPAQVITFNLVGGSTAISFSSTGVDVLWASPNPGFEVDINPGSTVRVEFESDDHRSRLEAWWSSGPQHQIREDQ